MNCKYVNSDTKYSSWKKIGYRNNYNSNIVYLETSDYSNVVTMADSQFDKLLVDSTSINNLFENYER